MGLLFELNWFILYRLEILVAVLSLARRALGASVSERGGEGQFTDSQGETACCLERHIRVGRVYKGLFEQLFETRVRGSHLGTVRPCWERDVCRPRDGAG